MNLKHPLSRYPSSAAATSSSGPSLLLRGIALASIALVAVLVFLTMTDLPNFVGKHSPIPPKYFYYLMVAATAGLLLVSSQLHLHRIRGSMVFFIVSWFGLNLLYAMFADVGSSEEVSQMAGMRLQFALLGLGLALAVTAVSRRCLAWIFFGCAIVLTLSMLAQRVSAPVTALMMVEGASAARVGGTLVNANKAGEAVILLALLSIPILNRRAALFLLGLSGLAVVVTFSRTAMVAWVILVGTFWFHGKLSRAQILGVIVAIAVLSAAGSVFSALMESQGIDRRDLVELIDRLNFLTTGDLADDSALSRAQVRSSGIEMFLAHPLFGGGPAATTLWEFRVGPHNQLVLLAAEYGLPGVAIWATMIWLVASGGYFASRYLQLTGAGLLVLFSMASHNLLDFPYWYLAVLTMAMRFEPDRALAPAAGDSAARHLQWQS